MFIDTLLKYNDCNVILHHKGKMKKRNDVSFIEVSDKEWDGRITICKIEKILSYSRNFKENDQIYIMDVDMLVKGDIFKIFNEKKFDVFYTSRHYEYHYPANAGTCGFRWNKNSKRWLEFYVEQMHNPTWEPVVNFRNRWKKINWFADQNFLCAIHNNKCKMPFNCEVIDLGPKYNFCPSAPDKITIEKAEKEIREKLNDDRYKVFHFKGKMKTKMEGIYNEIIRM